MNINRRKFFVKSGIAALGAVVVLPSANIFGQTSETGKSFPIPSDSTNDPFVYLSREHFESVVNTIFQFHPAEGRAFKLQLIAAEDSSLKANVEQGMTGKSFSLLFENGGKTRFPQGIYEVSHDTLGRFSLFIAPVGLRGTRYEAIVNRVNIPD